MSLSRCLFLTASIAVMGAPMSAQADDFDAGFSETLSFIPEWNFSSEASTVEPVTGDGNKTVRTPFAKLWPTETVVLDTPANNNRGRNLVEADTSMIVMRKSGVTLGCEVIRPSGHESFVCLVDAQNDGSFEGYYKALATLEYFFVPVRVPPSRIKPLDASVTYSDRGEWLEDDKLQMIASAWIDDDDLFSEARVGMSLCVTRTDLMNLFGGKVPSFDCLDIGRPIPIAQLPIRRMILGSVVELKLENEERVLLTTRPLTNSGSTTFN